jgi:hypothetical protein
MCLILFNTEDANGADKQSCVEISVTHSTLYFLLSCDYVSHDPICHIIASVTMITNYRNGPPSDLDSHQRAFSGSMQW